MSSCSATHASQIHTPPAPAGSLLQPMTVDSPRGPALAPAHSGSCPASPRAPGCEGEHDDHANGQHHLLRHVLSAQQCSDALRHFGTADSKAAARMVNRMSQRDLRDMFAKVYSVHTNSNNNTWLRRKLLEAVGASRRFYAAAAKSGRPRGARRTAYPLPGSAAPAPATATASPAASSAAAAPAASLPGLRLSSRAKHSPGGSPSPPASASSLAPPHTLPTAALHRQAAGAHHSHHHHQQHHHHVLAPGPALPAGSPRALTQRLRSAPRHHYSFSSAAAAGNGAGEGHPAAVVTPPQGQQRYSPFFQVPAFHQQQQQYHPLQHSSEDDTCSDGSVGDAAHPRGLAPQGMALGACTPTAAGAAQLPLLHPGVLGPALYSYTIRCDSGSPASSQFAAPLGFVPQQVGAPYQPAPAAAAAGLPVPPLGWDAKGGQLPHIASYGALSALLAGYPTPQQAAPLPAAAPTTALAPLDLQGTAGSAPALPAATSADLGAGLLSAIDASMAAMGTKQELGGDDWLAWDDLQLPALF